MSEAPPTDLPAVAVLHEAEGVAVFALTAAARGLCRLVWAVDLGDPRLALMRRQLARFGTVVDLHDRRGDDVAAECRDLGVAGVLTGTDPPIRYAAALAERLGLPFHSPDTARLLTDKAAQREALAVAGVPSAAARLVLAGAPAPTSFPVPAVVKPREGASSRGVKLVVDEAGLAEVFPAPEDLLLEERLIGRGAAPDRMADMVSVETMVLDGRPLHLAVTGRFPFAEPFRETGSFLPALLEPAERAAAEAVAGAAVAALGIQRGILHIELMLTADGPRVIEVNGRVGGGIPAIAALAGGGDLLRRALEVALGRDPEPLTPLSRVGFFLWCQPPVGAQAIIGLEGLDTVRAMPGVSDARVNRDVGAAVDWREGTPSHVYAVEGSAPDHASMTALRTGIIQTAQVTYH